MGQPCFIDLVIGKKLNKKPLAGIKDFSKISTYFRNFGPKLF